ncbi:MAG: hypothetical protein WCV73_03600 [Patescibacteria group bacterium]|jgi:hypothetical protein
MNSINFWQKHNTKIIIVFLIGCLIWAGWLLFQNYLKPTYELGQFLPPNYQISFEFKDDRFSFPKLQQQKILKNPGLNKIYQTAQNQLSNEMQKLPSEAVALLKRSDHLIVFWQDNKNYGLIVELKDQKSAKLAEQNNFGLWQKNLFKKQILLLASNQQILDQMLAQKISPSTPAYLSLTIAPWLQINLNQAFFNEPKPTGILNALQTALLPLKNNPNNNYQLTLDSSAYALVASLKPTLPQISQNDKNLNDYFNFLPEKLDLLFGLTDLTSIPAELENNHNFNKIWQQLDARLWAVGQTSLSNLLKNAHPPLLIGWSAENWTIITTIDNQELAKSSITSYLGQFKPKEATKILPDGTKAVELLADGSKISWQEVLQSSGWRQIMPKNSITTPGLGMAIKDKILVVSNKINDYQPKTFKLNCSITFTSQPGPLISNLFWLKTSLSWLKLAQDLQNFSNITAFTSTSGEINLCLGLK